jgi:hypothetical protein
MRPTEATALRVDDGDRALGSRSRIVQPAGRVRVPKTRKSRRRIAIVPELAVLVAPLIAEAPSGRHFISDGRGVPVHQDKWRAHRRAVAIEACDIRKHDLSRSAIRGAD